MFISATDSLLKGVLSTKAREKLKQKQFALPSRADDKEEKGESGNYPIPDLSHARSALALVAIHGSPSEQAKVRAAVYKKYPQLDKRKEETEKSVLISSKDSLDKATGKGKKGASVWPLPSPVVEEVEEEVEVKKSIDPALAARQNMKPMSIIGPMGTPVVGQAGFYNSVIASNFASGNEINFENKVIPVLRRPRK